MTAHQTTQAETAIPENVEPEEEEQPPAQWGEMTLIEHLQELKIRVIWSAGAVIVGVLVCIYFWSAIFDLLVAPAPKHPETGESMTLTSFSPLDRISFIFRVGLYGGVLLASPMLVYQALRFVTPGLTPRERRVLFPALGAVILFLLLGMAFAYWVILPRSLEFLLGLGDERIVDQQGLRQYTDFVTRIIFWVGLSFELPVVIAVIARLGLVRAIQLLKFWRYMIVLVFVIAALVTPTPDPLTQSMVALPLLVLYFLGVLFAWMLQPRSPTAEPAG